MRAASGWNGLPFSIRYSPASPRPSAAAARRQSRLQQLEVTQVERQGARVLALPRSQNRIGGVWARPKVHATPHAQHVAGGFPGRRYVGMIGGPARPRRTAGGARWTRLTGRVEEFVMDLGEKQLIESVFAGGGEMGARMRAVDWSATVLGPVSSGRSRCGRACASCSAPGFRCSSPGARTSRCSTTTPTGWWSEPSTRGRWGAVAVRCWPRPGIHRTALRHGLHPGPADQHPDPPAVHVPPQQLPGGVLLRVFVQPDSG